MAEVRPRNSDPGSAHRMSDRVGRQDRGKRAVEIAANVGQGARPGAAFLLKRGHIGRPDRQQHGFRKRTEKRYDERQQEVENEKGHEEALIRGSGRLTGR